MAGGGWQYVLEGAAYYTDTPPDDEQLIGDLGYQGAAQISDSTYYAFVDDLAPAVAYLKSTGEWYDPHPWLNVFLPDAATDALVTDVMSTLTLDDIGASGVVLLYPVLTAKLTAPLVRVPEGEVAFLFAVLRTASPDTNALPPATMLAANRELYLRTRGPRRHAVPRRLDPDDGAGLAHAVRRSVGVVRGGQAHVRSVRHPGPGAGDLRGASSLAADCMLAECPKL